MYKFTVKNLSLFIAGIALLLALVLRTFFIESFRSESLYLRDVQRNITQNLNQLTREAREIQRTLESNDSLSLSDFISDLRFPYFIFRDNQLAYWSNYRFVPSYQQLRGTSEFQYKEFDQGSYIIHQDSVNGWKFFQLLLIKENTEIDNQYVGSGYNLELFPQPETVDVREVLSVDAASNIISYQGHNLFSVQANAPPTGYREHDTAKSFQALITALIAVAILLLLLNVFRWAQQQFRSQRIDQGLLIVGLTLLTLRGLMIFSNYPYGILPIDLFDGRQFASSSINPSLGDLLLNCISVLIIISYSFSYYRDSQAYRKLISSKSEVKTIATVLGLILGLFALF
ncbi:MAG: hypothetical protein ACFB15_11315, partial [Cyclobacteriaceae bacterium]